MIKSNFNGQISISRDLRQNKQTVLSKYDLTDIIFILSSFVVAFIFAYVFGFLLKIMDELLAIVLSSIPMVLILALGFRKIAGMRYFDYLFMNIINRREKGRVNKAYINNVINIKNKIEKSFNVKKQSKNLNIIQFVNDKLFKKKSIKIEKNDNIKDIKIESRKKNVIDKSIFVLEVKEEEIENFINEYINNKSVEKIELRILNEESNIRYEILLLLNISYKEFYKTYINNEMLSIKKITIKDIEEKNKVLKSIKVCILKVKSEIKLVKDRFLYKYNARKKYKNKYRKFINLLSFNREFIPNGIKEFYDKFYEKGINFIDINDEYIKKVNILNKKVSMLHLYEKSKFQDYLNEIIKASNVVIYIVKRNDDIYINTFLHNDIENTDAFNKVSEISDKYNVILNNLSKEQGVAKSAITYYMYNPYNAYRKY